VDEYHEIADEYIDELVLTLEEKAEKGESGYEVEYSVCPRNNVFGGEQCQSS
jgi:frataxin-like iron-binding protein CyaY